VIEAKKAPKEEGGKKDPKGMSERKKKPETAHKKE